MADTLYAWSNLTKLDGTKVKPGETVTQSDLEKNDEEFKATYLDTGAVRTTPYPEDIASDESPMDYYRRQAAAINAGEVPLPAQVAEVAAGADVGNAGGSPPAQPDQQPNDDENK